MLKCQIFAKKMIEEERKGSIINISSVSSTIPLSRVFTYSISKAGVNNMTQFLAREFAPHGIRVNAIIPGFFPAEQNRKILRDRKSTRLNSSHVAISYAVFCLKNKMQRESERHGVEFCPARRSTCQ